MAERIHKPASRELPERWNPESIAPERLRALLPYTELGSIEAFRETLTRLDGILSRLPREHSRHLFIPRRGGRYGTEHVLHLGGRILSEELSVVEDCLALLGVDVEPLDALDRELIVATQRGRTTLGLLGLVAGYDEDALPSTGANWDAHTNAMMQEAAREDSTDDVFLGYQSRRAFPLRGDTRLRKLHPLLKQYFHDKLRPIPAELDPVELDELIDDVSIRFESGELSLDDAFHDLGLDTDEHVADDRTTIPSGARLGEQISPTRNPRFRWVKGGLFKRDPVTKESVQVTPMELLAIYRRAKPAASLLWQADMLRRKAGRIAEDASGYDRERAERYRLEASGMQAEADKDTDGLRALADAMDVNTGLVFVRVMRFLKRRDVQLAGSYGPHDLMQEGMLGVYNTIAHFEPELDGASFVGYARYRIDASIFRYAVENRTFTTISSGLQKTVNKLYDIESKGDRFDATDPALDTESRRRRRYELAEAIFGSKYSVDWFLDKTAREVLHPGATTIVPIDDIDTDDSSVVDMNGQDLSSSATDAPVAAEQSRDLLSRILTLVLTPREERVIRLRFGIGPLLEPAGELTLDETAEYVQSLAHGQPLSRERMRQMEAKALRKLKRHLYLRFGRRDSEGTKYVDIETLARVFDIPGYR